MKVNNVQADLNTRTTNNLGKIFLHGFLLTQIILKAARGCEVLCQIAVPDMYSDFITKYHEEVHSLIKLKAGTFSKTEIFQKHFSRTSPQCRTAILQNSFS